MKRPIKLKLQKTVKVRPVKPFDFDSTFHKPDHFTSGKIYGGREKINIFLG